MQPLNPLQQLGFGQRIGGIMQMAYVVEDIHAAIDWWVRDTRTGPWFLLDSFLQPDHRYRGAPSTADIKIAMSFAGHMNIELIQPKDDQPSVYRELIQRRGFGFHHVGIASLDVDSDIREYEALGYSLAFRAGVPTGGAVAYMDGGPDQPHYVELIPVTPLMDEAFTGFYHAALGWDGCDPIRTFG